MKKKKKGKKKVHVWVCFSENYLQIFVSAIIKPSYFVLRLLANPHSTAIHFQTPLCMSSYDSFGTSPKFLGYIIICVCHS